MIAPEKNKDQGPGSTKAKGQGSAKSPKAVTASPDRIPSKEEKTSITPQTTRGDSSPINKISLKINAQQGKDKKGGHHREESAGEKPTAAFAYNDFLNCWNRLASSYKEESLALFMAMTKEKPRLLKDNRIMVGIDNAIQQDLILEKMPELLSALHTELKNYSIRIETEIQNARAKQKAYLPKEKLQELIKKNPDVKRLKDELGLDLDY